MEKRLIIPIFVPHIGCSGRCVYCDQEIITSTSSRLPTSASIKKVIDSYLEQRRYNKGEAVYVQLAFYGGNFTGLPFSLQQRLLQIAKPFIDDGQVHSLRLSTMPKFIYPAVLKLLAQFHVQTIELGAQSLSDEVLTLCGRGYTRMDVINSYTVLKKEGFETGIQLMVGMPGDTREGFFNTVEEVIKLSPDFVRIYPTVVIKGTVLEQWFLAGHYQPL